MRECEYISESDPAVLRVLLKIKPGLGEGYDWVGAAVAAPAGRFCTTPRASGDAQVWRMPIAHLVRA